MGIFALVILILGVVIVFMGAKVVSQGYEYTTERLGRYTRTLKPGFHVIIPIIDRIGGKINMQEQVLDIPSQEAITRDNTMVKMDGVLAMHNLTMSARNAPPCWKRKAEGRREAAFRDAERAAYPLCRSGGHQRVSGPQVVLPPSHRNRGHRAQSARCTVLGTGLCA